MSVKKHAAPLALVYCVLLPVLMEYFLLPTRVESWLHGLTHHWRTALALITSAIDRENANSARFLQAFLRFGFERLEGGQYEPVRYPSHTVSEEAQKAHKLCCEAIRWLAEVGGYPVKPMLPDPSDSTSSIVVSVGACSLNAPATKSQ